MANQINCQWCGKLCHPNDVHFYDESMHGTIPQIPFCVRCWDDNHEIIKAGGTPFSSVVPGRKLPNGGIVIMFEKNPDEPTGVVLAMWERNYGWEYVCWLVGPHLGCTLGYYHRGPEGLALAVEKFKERISRWERRDAYA